MASLVHLRFNAEELRLIQDMPIWYVHLLPHSRIVVHRDEFPHEAVPSIFCGWVIGTIGIPVFDLHLSPLPAILAVIPPHHTLTCWLCRRMKSVVHLPVWNEALLPNMNSVDLRSLADCGNKQQKTSSNLVHQPQNSELRPPEQFFKADLSLYQE